MRFSIKLIYNIYSFLYDYLVCIISKKFVSHGLEHKVIASLIYSQDGIFEFKNLLKVNWSISKDLF